MKERWSWQRAPVVALRRPDESHYGVRAIEEIRAEPELNTFPIALCTGVEEQLALMLERLGTLRVPVLRKPFDMAEVSATWQRDHPRMVSGWRPGPTIRDAVDEAILGWAQVPGMRLWHRVRAVNEADARRATIVHGACGLTFRSDEPLQLTRPKVGPICRGCSVADDAEHGINYPGW